MSIEATPDTGEMKCARHPKVETRLACGRCETPICPKCMVMTDVGARCPDCAPSRKLPQFELGPLMVLRAVGASAVAGAVIGVMWGLLLYDFGLFLVIFAGLALGYAIAEPIGWATNKKSGPVLQGIAVGGCVLAYFVRNIVAGEALIPTGDLSGYVVLVVGAIVAVNRLRY
jgi:hypothetical protein